MTIIVNSKPVKTYYARYGFHNVFGKDVDDRKNFTEEQAIERFDQVWENCLRRAVETAPACATEDAYELLETKQQQFFKSDLEHRQFWLENGLFLAQLNPIDGFNQELTQLWFVRSSNVDPRTVFITFDSVLQREEFHQAAAQLGYADEALGKKLLTDFMETVLKKAVQNLPSSKRN